MNARVQRTLLGSVGLHEALPRACLLELGGQPCQLGEVLVHDAHVRGQAVVVDVLCEVAADIAWGRQQGARSRRQDSPSPPMINTDGCSAAGCSADMLGRSREFSVGRRR